MKKDDEFRMLEQHYIPKATNYFGNIGLSLIANERQGECFFKV